MMFGQSITLHKRCRTLLGESILKLEDLTVSDWRVEVRRFSLEVRSGEVIGLAGLEANGQHLLLRACAGLLRPSSGCLKLGGLEMTGRSYRQFLAANSAYMPVNRLEEGLITGMTVAEHVTLVEKNPPFFIDWGLADKIASQRIEKYHIKGTPESPVEELSGGNQQRCLLALLPDQPRLLLMEHPTRGLDMESAEYIWRLLLRQTRMGPRSSSPPLTWTSCLIEVTESWSSLAER